MYPWVKNPWICTGRPSTVNCAQAGAAKPAAKTATHAFHPQLTFAITNLSAREGVSLGGYPSEMKGWAEGLGRLIAVRGVRNLLQTRTAPNSRDASTSRSVL